jgi:hypothetical protein
VATETPEVQPAGQEERQRRIDAALPFGRSMVEADLAEGRNYSLLNPVAILAILDDYSELRVVVEGLRTQLADTEAWTARIEAEYRALGVQVAAVKALHFQDRALPEVGGELTRYCAECGDVWPCRTVEAVGGLG